MTELTSDSSHDLARRVLDGDAGSWDDLTGRVEARLRRLIAARMDPRLRSRFDPSDVLQDAYLEAAGRLREYVETPGVPFFLWMRNLAGHYLGRLHRDHLGRQCRDARREVSIDRAGGGMPDASSVALAEFLVGREARPSEAAVRVERQKRIREVLELMDPLDREALSLRHFEQLSRSESAAVLGISEAAVAKRYLRALARLREVLSTQPGGLDGFR